MMRMEDIEEKERKEDEENVKEGLGREVAGAGAGELVGVDEEASVGVTGVHREHPVVDVLLGALRLVAGGQQPAGAVREQAGLQPGGLGVVVVTVAVSLGDVLEDDPPVALNIDGPCDLGVVHVGGTEVALGSDPVGSVVLAGSLAGSGVVRVVEALLLRLGDHLNEVVSALVSDVGVLLEEESVLGDLERDVVGGVLLVHHAEREVGALGALGGRLGVTVSVSGGGVGRGVDGGGAVGGGGRVDGVMHRVHQLVRPDEGRDEDEETCNLAN